MYSPEQLRYKGVPLTQLTHEQLLEACTRAFNEYLVVSSQLAQGKLPTAEEYLRLLKEEKP